MPVGQTAAFRTRFEVVAKVATMDSSKNHDQAKTVAGGVKTYRANPLALGLG
jgi:hypothetical protein